jgi:hypothetical protein
MDAVTPQSFSPQPAAIPTALPRLAEAWFISSSQFITHFPQSSFVHWFAFIYASAIKSENRTLRTAMTSSLSTSTTNPIVIAWVNMAKHRVRTADSTKRKQRPLQLQQETALLAYKHGGFLRLTSEQSDAKRGHMVPSCMRCIMNVSGRLRGSSGPQNGIS